MLSLNLFSYIDRHRSRHLRNDYITGVGILALYRVKLVVVDEAVESSSDEFSRIIIILRLICMRIPVGRHNADRILVYIFSIGSELYNFSLSFFLIAVAFSVARLVNGTLSGLGIIVGSVIASGKHGNDHE